MPAPEPEAAVREAIRKWPRLLELVEFAVRRHGFADCDGGFGVTYPGDLDELDRVSGAHIADGFVQVYGFWGPPDGYEMFVPETNYLRILVAVLSASGHADGAARVQALLESTSPGEPAPSPRPAG